jgi:hypothetical protein
MIKLLARSADNSKMICVIVVEEAGLKGTGINDEYIGGLKRGFTGNGGTIISDQRMQLAGVPAYEVIGRIPAPGKTLSTKMHSTVADGRSYAVQIMDAEGDVTRDRQLGQIMATFHFLKPPKISPLDGRSAAFRIGYLFGRVGVVAVLVAVVVLIIRKARRPKPPPLPPA